MPYERILEFKVDEQRLQKKPGCDFSNIVAGTSNYLKAKFCLSEEWNGCKIAASFAGFDGGEDAVLLDENRECFIPSTVLTGDHFKVWLVAVHNEPNYIISTNRMTVKQKSYLT